MYRLGVSSNRNSQKKLLEVLWNIEEISSEVIWIWVL